MKSFYFSFYSNLIFLIKKYSIENFYFIYLNFLINIILINDLKEFIFIYVAKLLFYLHLKWFYCHYLILFLRID